jgi:hypothetical protein
MRVFSHVDKMSALAYSCVNSVVIKNNIHNICNLQKNIVKRMHLQVSSKIFLSRVYRRRNNIFTDSWMWKVICTIWSRHDNN